MYVLLGSNGNITSKAAALLLEQGAKVRVVGRNAQTLATLKAAGADIAVGDITDAKFLARAFEGATAVYAMLPPDYTAADMPAAQDRLGEAIVAAITTAKVKRVVNLSSIGAHVPTGTGPIAGLYRQEQRLNKLAGVDVLHLRPGYFYENHLFAIGTIQALGAYADMTAPDVALPMVATADIAQVVARELLTPSTPADGLRDGLAQAGKGKRVLHLRAPKLYTMRESTAVLGAAIGKTSLPYVQAEPAQAKAAMVQHGLSSSTADQFEEMSEAFSTGRLNGEHDKGPTEIASMPLEQFATTVFKPAFQGAR